MIFRFKICLRAQVVQVYPKLMAGEVLIQDAASLAARGEELTYWQMQARVHSVRQTLLGAPPHIYSRGQERFVGCQLSVPVRQLQACAVPWHAFHIKRRLASTSWC